MNLNTFHLLKCLQYLTYKDKSCAATTYPVVEQARSRSKPSTYSKYIEFVSL